MKDYITPLSTNQYAKHSMGVIPAVAAAVGVAAGKALTVAAGAAAVAAGSAVGASMANKMMGADNRKIFIKQNTKIHKLNEEICI